MDIIDHIDQCFREFESWAQPRNIGWNDQKGLTKPTTTLCNRDQGVSEITSSAVTVEDLLSSICQCPRIQRRISSMHHERGCIFSFNNRKKRSLTTRFRIFQRQVTATWELEYPLLTWSRNWRINRNITIHAIVPFESPAFQVLTSMHHKITGVGTTRDLRMIFQDGLVELEKVFRNGLAWPTDALFNGLNLLYIGIFIPMGYLYACVYLISLTAQKVAISLIHDIRNPYPGFSGEFAMLRQQFMQALIQIGVPTNDPAETG